MINIGNLIWQAHDLSFQCWRASACFVIPDPVNDFPCKIQSPSFLFYRFHHSHTLLIVFEPSRAKFIERTLPCMPERCMSQIMPQGNCFYQFLIKPECFRNCSCILWHLQCMCQPCTVMISFRKKKHLGLLLQSAERLAVHDPVTITLKDRTNITFLFLNLPAFWILTQCRIRT